MNSVVWLVLAACMGGIYAAPSFPPLPVNPGGIGGLFRGPNQETIIRGPDGSEITSEHLGGAVQSSARLEPIIVPDEISLITASQPDTISFSNNINSPPLSPVVTISENSASPLLVSSEGAALLPQVTQASSDIISQTPAVDIHTPAVQLAISPAEEPHIIETEFVDAPDVEPNQNSDLKGPSGSISVRGSSSIVSGPASTTISEPVRKIPVAAVEVAATPILAPSAVLLPPGPSAVDGYQLVNSQASQSPISLPPQSYQFPSSPLELNSGLSPPNSQVPVTTVRLGDRSSIPPQSQTVSSTPIPPEALPPNAIDLGQTIVSTTHRSNIPPSNADIDVSRINLGQGSTQQVSSLSVGDSGLVSSSTVSPLDAQYIASSTSSPYIISPTQIPQTHQQNVAIPQQPNRPLFTTVSDDYNIQPGVPSTVLTPPNQIFTPNGPIYPQEPSVVTNQIVPNDPKLVPSSIVQNGNLPQTSWVNVQEDHILPSTVAPPQSGTNIGPISTVLDTVLVQPTDPRNREVIEFGGKKLENVGNIVPVIHHPVLVAGGLTHLQHIPTSSIGQLTNGYGRYGRQLQRKN